MNEMNKIDPFTVPCKLCGHRPQAALDFRISCGNRKCPASCIAVIQEAWPTITEAELRHAADHPERYDEEASTRKEASRGR